MNNPLLALLLIAATVCVLAFTLFSYGERVGLQKGLSVGVDNCDPYLPADPRMR